MSRMGWIGLLVGLLVVGTASAQSAPDDTSMHWSLDSKQIAFFSNPEGLGIDDLYVKDVAGGEARLLGEDIARLGFRVIWLPDAIVFDEIIESTANHILLMNQLHIADAATGISEVLFGYEAFAKYDLLGLSPDGQWLAVGKFSVDENLQGATQPLILYNVHDQTKTEIVIHDEAGAESLKLVWSPDGKRFALVVLAKSDYQLYLYIYDVASGKLTPTPIVRDPLFSRLGSFIWSPDSTRLLINFPDDPTVYALDVVANTFTPRTEINPPLELLTWLPSGRIVYSTQDQNAMQVSLWGITPDDPTPQLLVSAPGLYSIKLAPDGVHVLVTDNVVSGATPDTYKNQLWKVFDLETGSHVDIPLPPRSNSGWLEWSPDSRFIAIPLCVENDFDIFTVDAQTGAIRNLMAGDGTDGMGGCVHVG